jgi:hypothetical protein
MSRIRSAFAALSLTAFAASCASYSVYTRDGEKGPDYVVLKVLGNRESVFDCYSYVDGGWQPTCVKVRFKQNARERDGGDERGKDD